MEINNKTILASILFILFPWLTPLRAATASVYGDVNGDGEVTIADVNAVLDVIMGDEYNAAADVNNDGEVNIADINVIISIILGDFAPVTETFTVNGVTFKMIRVEGGTYTMGATPEQGSDAYNGEKPAHQVLLSSYYIGETEVTQALWKAVMGNNPSHHKGDVNLPVEKVQWDDCQAFVMKMNELTGQQFRLPTEAEWEFAARGGNNSLGYKYAGSNTIEDVAWYYFHGMQTHAVGTLAPNELGLYDMSGNVYEWCQDWYGRYENSPQTNPTGPETGTKRVYRGGSWGSGARSCRVSDRSLNVSDANTYAGVYFGLRLAL